MIYEILPDARPNLVTVKYLGSDPNVFSDSGESLHYIAFQKHKSRAVMQTRDKYFRAAFLVDSEDCVAVLTAEDLGYFLTHPSAKNVRIAASIVTGMTEREAVQACLAQGWRAFAFSSRDAMLQWLFSPVE